MLKEPHQNENPVPLSGTNPCCPHRGELLFLDIRLQSHSVLINILSILSRLGCELLRMRFEENHARFSLRPPSHLRHRVVPMVSELIEVLEVQESQAD
ncbi:MAG: hypothetical protein N2112_14815 [Gemmataceae bacterium]|nr:hypothetical protein [Gemmataceae bacterium]